jgi:hypothetical protein
MRYPFGGGKIAFPEIPPVLPFPKGGELLAGIGGRSPAFPSWGRESMKIFWVLE